MFQLRGNDSRTVEDKAVAKALLLVPARACLASWDVGHRAEGGVLLSHLIGSGSEASRIIQPVARLMKKVFMNCLTSFSFVFESNVLVAPLVAQSGTTDRVPLLLPHHELREVARNGTIH